MACPDCGAPLRTDRSPFAYELSGVLGLTLVGAEVERCTRCNYYEVAIPSVAGLHRAIARALVDKPTPLTPEELWFLRTYLDGLEVEADAASAPPAARLRLVFDAKRRAWRVEALS